MDRWVIFLIPANTSALVLQYFGFPLFLPYVTMQPATANRQALDGRPIPHRWATPGQQAQAVLWLADKLRHHFPTLSVTGWSQAFHEFQPDLWEDNDGSTRHPPHHPFEGLSI